MKEGRPRLGLCIGMPHAGPAPIPWLQGYEMLQKPPDYLPIHLDRGVVSISRNLIVAAALAHWRREDAADPTRDAADDVLWFLDDDLLWQPDALTRLLAHRLPIVSGLYFLREEPHLPVAGRQVSAPGELPRRTVNLRRIGPGLQEVDYTGAGCLLIRRDVLEALESQQPWFDYTCGTTRVGVPREERWQPTLSDAWPEDWYFCQKARDAGYHIALDASVLGAHLSHRLVTIDDAVQQAQSGGWVPFPPEEAELEHAAHTVRPWPPTDGPTQ